MVNRRPVIACGALAEKEMTIGPVQKYQVSKDFMWIYRDERTVISIINSDNCDGCGIYAGNFPLEVLGIVGGK